MTSFLFTVIKGGKPKFPALTEQVKLYAERLKVKDPLASIVRIKEEDTLSLPMIERFLSPQDYLVVLDERGVSLSSNNFAERLQKIAVSGQSKKIVFVVGGPFGIDENLRQHADLLLRLSDFVFTSDLAWLILWEQIYRAQSLLRGKSPYHHG